MKIYFAGVPGGGFKSAKKRLSMIKNRLLSYYFINIKKDSKPEMEKIIKSK